MTKEKTIIKEYSTTDFYFSCYLLTKGYRLLRTEGEKKRKMFVFVGELKEIEDEYQTFFIKKEAWGNIRDFVDNIFNLKGLIKVSE
jgi:hypothetical protein